MQLTGWTNTHVHTGLPSGRTGHRPLCGVTAMITRAHETNPKMQSINKDTQRSYKETRRDKRKKKKKDYKVVK